MSMSDRIVAVIRTAVPSLYGMVLAWLIAQIPAVGDVLVWLSVQAGTDVSRLIELILTALVIGAFYWLARWLGARFPWVEKWLLGSSLTPMYAPEIVADVNTGAVALVSRREYQAYLQAITDDADAARAEHENEGA